MQATHADATASTRTTDPAAVLDRAGGPAETRDDARTWLDRLDAVYRDANGDPRRVPWQHRQPSPAMVVWMDAIAPTVLRPGARVAVAGCGLGQEAACLAGRGYDVTAFDASPAAIEWAARLHPACADIFCVADLFDLPSALRGRFDLVVDVHTLQSLPPVHRSPLARGIAALLCHSGTLLSICRGRPDAVPLNEVAGPPFGFTPAELDASLRSAGLEPAREIDDFEDDGRPPVRRLRATYRRRQR